MTTDSWKTELDAKCETLVDSFSQLYAHIDALENIEGITVEEVEELCAVAAVKIMRARNKTFNIAYALDQDPKTNQESNIN